MAKHFQNYHDEKNVSCLYLDDILEPELLSKELKRRPQWAPLHDRVMAEFHKPLIALIWRGYKADPAGISERDVMLEVFGVTIITPAEANEMRYAIKSSSFLNRN